MPVLAEGDWLSFANMGAYTTAAGSTFNGMPRPDVHYYIAANDLLVAQIWFSCLLQPVLLFT